MKRILYPRSENPIRESDTIREQALKDAMLARGEHVYGYLCKLTHGDSHLAEDLFEETWTSAYKSFKTEQFTHIALLKRRAKQVFINHKRKADVRSIVEFRADMDDIPVEYVPKEEGTAGADAAIREKFWSMFAPLDFDPVDKECFWLLHRYGFTIEEVSLRVKMPVSTIHDRVSKLKRACVERLEEEI
jgi:DNA-directed RNA polymerase specialized sigma24 family protein